MADPLEAGFNARTDPRQLARQVQRVADELEIRNLVANVYLMADAAADLDVYGQSFTEDAIWERVDGKGPRGHTGTHLVGRDRILADRRALREKRYTGPASRRRLLLTTLAVTLHDDGTATARSKYLVVHSDVPGLVISSIGEYNDTVHRTDAGWKLRHRRYSAISAAESDAPLTDDSAPADLDGGSPCERG